LSRAFDNQTGGHGGDLVRAARQWNPAGGELLDFSSNVNPLGPPSGLIEYLSETLTEIVNYPSPQARELREDLAFFLDVPLRQLLLGNGANELIHLLILWHRPRRVLVPAPAFSEYERAAVLAGSLVERYPLRPGEHIDPVFLESRLEQGDWLVICNPSNPTGMLHQRCDLLKLLAAAEKRDASVMIDESFIPLSGRPEESLRDRQNAKLWVVISLTKLWALPGLRLGCLIGPESEVEKLTRWGDPWRVNILAQAAGTYCLEKKDYLAETLDLIEKERNFLSIKFKETGCFRVFNSAANFLLVQGTDPAFNVAAFQDYLARRGVLIRRADNFYGLDQSYFRVAVLKRANNLRLIRETEHYLRSSQYCKVAAEKNSKTGTGDSAGGDRT